MTDNHPITPPPELVEQWECEYHHMTYGPDLSIFISEKAARWGSDQELEACCEWAAQLDEDLGDGFRTELRAARRPKPPNLKEQALEAHGPEPLPEPSPNGDAILNAGAIERHRLVRRAIEALPDS